MKKWYKSRTIIVNLLTLMVGILGVFQGTDWIVANPQVSAAIVVALSVINLYLRKKTVTSIN